MRRLVRSDSPYIVITFFVLFFVVASSVYAAPLRDDGKQAKRKELISRMCKLDVIEKVEVVAEYPHITVGKAFYPLSFDAKSDFIQVIVDYYAIKNGKKRIGIVYDYYTGKRIGAFGPITGFYMD